jgi:hypothetical protein
VVTLLNLTTWDKRSQELIILIFLDLILGEVTSISLGLLLGGDLGCVDVSLFPP